MKGILKQLEKIKETWGINAFDDIMKFNYTLIRKIEDLMVSREKWKSKYMKLKKEIGI